MPSQPHLVNPDPTIQAPEQAQSDMQQHVRTYNKFVHLLWWFILHIPFLLFGLYAMTLGGQLIAGVLLVGLGIAILVIGSIRTIAL